ncbi:MAG TPA: uracil-DNA glycosylase [Saprospiraceae bacterium]|nr:uracil-DNA glycosylase [Saprospiraceae bacterium]
MSLNKVDPGTVKIEPGWKAQLAEEFAKPYFTQIRQFLSEEKAKGKTIFPPGPLIFNAFDKTPFDKVRVVILGQDPYHGPGQAMGLCFSVPRNIAVPASLRNIYKELHRDTGFRIPHHGDLSSWTSEGVFLLNATLTVEKNLPNSHSNIGWQLFTDAIIKKLSDQKRGIIFLLWGNNARMKKHLIDTAHNIVLEAAHPSPLARDAFYGCAHFSKVNRILMERGEPPINWNIDE